MFYNSNSVDSIQLFQDYTAVRKFSASGLGSFFMIPAKMLAAQWYKSELEIIQQRLKKIMASLQSFLDIYEVPIFAISNSIIGLYGCGMLEKKKKAVAIALYFQIHLRAQNAKTSKKKKQNREPCRRLLLKYKIFDFFESSFVFI